jgi:hypothetical protein
MATTTNYGWTTPDDTALVKDGASAIRTLGSSVDTTTKALNPSTTLGDIEYRSSTSNTNTRVGIGTTGQALTVVGGVPSWAASPTSVLTTTGDTLYASSANTLARVGIGTAGQVLKVNSGATAPEWGSVSSVKPFMTIKNAGRYVRSHNTLGSNLIAATEDVTYYIPIYFDGFSFDRISTRSAGNFVGSSIVRLGIYNASATTGLPDTVYLDAGTVSFSAANTILEITISTTPPAGYYYLAWNSQTAAATNNYTGFDTAPLAHWLGTDTDVGSSNTRQWFYTQTGVTGAFATAGTLITNTSGTIPIVAMRIA